MLSQGFKTSYQNESQFIVDEVLTDIAEMACYSANKKLPDTKRITVRTTEQKDSKFRAPVYDVEMRLDKTAVKFVLKIEGPIWSPANYFEAAAKMAGALRLPQGNLPAAGAEDASLLKALLDEKPGGLARRDRELSDQLRGDFTNPDLHEKAALLLGVFALRDSAAAFYDVRLPLCRMTAHLAFSRGLSGDTRWGIHGRVANAMIMTIENNERDALAELERWQEPSLETWRRVLAARNRHDYRELQKVKQRTLVENVEMFRAYTDSVDADTAMEHTTPAELEQSTDYWRAAGAWRGSVAVGNAYLQQAMQQEMKEVAAVYQTYHPGRNMDEKAMIEALNVKPGRCVSRNADGTARVEAVGWSQWSFFLQRHLLGASGRSVDMLRWNLGLESEAKNYARELEKSLGDLYLFPFALYLICSDEAAYGQSVDGMAAVTEATPQLVSSKIWFYIYDPPRFAPQHFAKKTPNMNLWFKHTPPPGTVYDLGARLNQPTLVSRPDVRQLFDKFLAIAPYDFTVAQNTIAARYQSGRPSYEQMEPVYRAGLDFNVHYMQVMALALTNRPAEYEKMMLKIAESSPCIYRTLGIYYLDKGEEQKGIQYLEKSMAECGDAVANASQAGRLIRYYWNQGEKKKAYDVADFAADQVYSGAGLRAKGELLEMDGRYKEAAEYYRKLEERYNTKYDVLRFVARYKAKVGDNAFDDLVKSRVNNVYPAGMEKVKLADFKEAPADGVYISATGPEVTRAGLSQGHIIVALYGTRVHDMDQYGYLRDSSSETELDLIVWTGTQFIEVKASPPKLRFGVDFTNYKQR